ncbi:MAG: two-component system response regulator [Lachnospiraceae bacterium]
MGFNFGEKPKILIVDDSAINLAYAEQKLKEYYDVVTINSGTRAVRYLKGNRPDLILLDIRMADKDGIQTLREIREIEGCKELPVIMLTSKCDKDSILETQKLGISDYVLKPFETEALRSRIQRALKREEDAE